MKKRCEKGKPCGATCIDRDKECLKGLPQSLTKPLGQVRGVIRKPAKYKIAKSAEPSARPAQLTARRVLMALEGDNRATSTNGAVKEGKVKWDETLKSGVFGVGRGDFGSFMTVASAKLIPGSKGLPNEVGVKAGKIGLNEVKALKIVGNNDLGPKLLAAKESSEVKGKRFETRAGVVAMTKVPGTAYYRTPDSVRGFPKSEMYWEAMANLHRLGIAHNDLHGGNVFIDSSPMSKARIIDFGLAQLSPKAALAEGLGSLSGANFQFVASKKAGHALTVKANLFAVEYTLMEKGFTRQEISQIMDGAIRKKDSFYNKGPWGKLTNDDAKELIQYLYDGVGD